MEQSSFPFLTCILGSCVIGLLAILCLPSQAERMIKWAAASFSGLTLILAAYLCITYNQAQAGLQFVEKILWVDSLGIYYFNAADGFNLPLLLLTGIVFFTGVLSMWDLRLRVKEFFALYFLLVSGVFGLFMSMDLFFIFVWYDVSLFPMYLLIAVWGSTRKEYGAMKLTLYLLAGSALILPAILYLVAQSGLNTFDVTALMRPGLFSTDQQKWAFLAIYIGFGILAGVWPLHTWSPVGHSAAPTSVSMLHAGVLMKIGAFGILRVGIFLCPEGWRYFAPLMAWLACGGIIYGVLAGLRQTDLKYIVGYSSVSHMGIVGLGLSTVSVGGLNGAVFQMFAHGIMTALLFSTIGYIQDQTHTKSIENLGGLNRAMPIASTFFLIAALTAIGVPCLASFWAELTVFIAAFPIYPFQGSLAVIALVISALFLLRVIQKAFHGPPDNRWNRLPDMSRYRILPRAILVAVIVLFGFTPGWMIDLIQTASAPFLSELFP